MVLILQFSIFLYVVNYINRVLQFSEYYSITHLNIVF